MTVNTKLVSAINRTIELAGTQLRIRYYNPIYDDVYDEETELMQSGTDLWISGVVLPLNSRQGSNDSVLLQQMLFGAMHPVSVLSQLIVVKLLLTGAPDLPTPW